MTRPQKHTRLFTGTCSTPDCLRARAPSVTLAAPRETPSHARAIEHSSTRNTPGFQPARASALLKRKRLEHSSAAKAHPTVYGHVRHTRLFTGTCTQYLTGTRRGHSSRDAPRETPSHACAVEHSSTGNTAGHQPARASALLKRTRLEHSSAATHTRLFTGMCSTPSSRAGTCPASR